MILNLLWESFYVAFVALQGMKKDQAWRAMLIKDSEGDWGVLKATWTGMRSGVPGQGSEPIIAEVLPPPPS